MQQAAETRSSLLEQAQLEHRLSHAILDTVEALVVVLDHRGRIIRFNTACEALTGYLFEEIKDTLFWQTFILPEERGDYESLFRHISDAAVPNHRENVWVTKEGRQELISWSNATLRNKAGTVEFVIATGIPVTERRQAEEALHATEKRSSLALEAARMSTWEFNLVTGEHIRSKQNWALLGLPEETRAPSQAEWESRLHPDDHDRVTAQLDRAVAGAGEYNVEYRLLWPDGSIHWTAAKGQAIRDDQGRPVRFIGVSQDITERKLTEEALLEAERNYRSIFENALDGIFQTTAAGNYLRVNPALARIYGYDSPQELINSLRDIKQQLYVDPTRRPAFIQQMQARDSVSGFEAQIYRKDGSIIWIAEHARAVRDSSGALLYYEGTVQDITERKNLEAERERLLVEALERADNDPLTGLLNHRAFHKRYQEEAERARREGTVLAVAVMDLDNFKFFNDAYGHAVGDDVLRRVAETLRGGCRRYDILARFGGDEFALLMPGTTQEAAARLADRLKIALEEVGYRPVGSESAIPLTLSIGLAVYPHDGQERLDVLETADARLIRTKTGGNDDEAIESLRSLLTSSRQGFSMLDALVTAVDNKDRYTRKHSEDVMSYALQITRALGLDEEAQRVIQVAALLHDVGKIGVPDRILRKPGGLTDEEFEAIKQHPAMGAVIVGAVPGFEETLDAIRHHHERWDGRGYPDRLKGAETPLPARIMAVADAYSALTMDRPYRKGKQPEEALAVLCDGAGSQWDADCVRAFRQSRYGAVPRASSGGGSRTKR